MNKNDIQKQLNDLLRSYPVDCPVEVFDLAKRMGYEIFRFYPSKDSMLPKISGALVYNQKRIFINGDEPLNRQHFTCAHELGHAILHRMDRVDEEIAFRIEGDSNSMEIDANHFAASLLMPENYLRDWYASLPKSKTITERVEELANYFQVSAQAMFYRLKNLDLLSKDVSYG